MAGVVGESIAACAAPFRFLQGMAWASRSVPLLEVSLKEPPALWGRHAGWGVECLPGLLALGCHRKAAVTRDCLSDHECSSRAKWTFSFKVPQKKVPLEGVCSGRRSPPFRSCGSLPCVCTVGQLISPSTWPEGVTAGRGMPSQFSRLRHVLPSVLPWTGCPMGRLELVLSRGGHHQTTATLVTRALWASGSGRPQPLLILWCTFPRADTCVSRRPS